MKPIIIIKEKTANGKFEFTEKELNELIEQAYNQGVADGTKAQQYKPIVLDNGGRDMTTTPNYPHDIYGNPIPYCIGTTVTDTKDTRAVLTLTNEPNDLVYRGGDHKVISPKQGEPIPCGTTSRQLNPEIKLNGSAVSTGV